MKIMLDKIKLISYNCNSLRNFIDEVRYLLSHNDIVFLQETLVFSTDSEFVNRIDLNFNSMIVSCTRKDGIDSGRPRGGFIIFWRKWLNSYVFPVSHSKEFCRIDLKIGSQTYSLFNVYFPCDNRSIDSLVVFRETLANLSTTLDDFNISKVIIIGDMNTHPNRGQYWAELSDFTNDYNFKFADITNLPIDSFTFYSSANDVVSWIDHILVSDLDIVSNIQIRKDLTISDHFPISCE